MPVMEAKTIAEKTFVTEKAAAATPAEEKAAAAASRALSRQPEIDTAKGMALMATVLGHILLLHDWPSNWIFTFHMPAFFFLSGMTFKPERYSGYGHFLKEKWKKRLIPYLVIVGAAFLVCMLRPSYRLPVLADGWRTQLIWSFYYTQPRNLYVGQAWFLIALFLAELMAYSWFKLFGKRHFLIKCYSLLLLAVIAVHIRRIDPFLPVGERLPWKMDSALCAAVFLLAGWGIAKWGGIQKLRPMAPFLFPLFTALSFYFGPRLFGYVNICDCVYVGAPYYYTAAFLGIAALMMAALLLKGSRFLRFCGRNSLPLFALQTFAIYLVIEAIEKATGTAYIPMFEMPGYKACLAVFAAAFGLMLLFLWPWQLYKAGKGRKAHEYNEINNRNKQ